MEIHIGKRVAHTLRRRYLTNARAASFQDTAARAARWGSVGPHGSLEFFFAVRHRVLPENDMLVLSQRQFQQALGNRRDPPCGKRRLQEFTYVARMVLKRENYVCGPGIRLLCLGLSRKGLPPASSRAILFLAPSRFGANNMPADSMA